MARKATITFSLDTEADKDIIRWLDRQDNRSAAIRDAIREHLARGGITLADVYQALKMIERKLESGIVVSGAPTGAPEVDEPADLVAALDALADLGG